MDLVHKTVGTERVRRIRPELHKAGFDDGVIEKILSVKGLVSFFMNLTIDAEQSGIKHVLSRG